MLNTVKIKKKQKCKYIQGALFKIAKLTSTFGVTGSFTRFASFLLDGVP